MSILIDETTRVIVQGLTGTQASDDVKFCLEYGTKIVAGVVPGRGGQAVLGVPIYDSVRSAVREHNADVSILYIPPSGALDAALEAIDAGIGVIQIITEGVPFRDFARIYASARKRGTIVLGPNSNGMISPGKAKIGIMGNSHWFFPAGRIGILSRSGGICNDLGCMLRDAGLGISTAISMGGDPMIGSSFAELLVLFENDPGTDAVVMFCDPGPAFETEAARLLRDGRFTKPLVAFFAGRFLESMPRGVSFGHTGAMIERGSDAPSRKAAELGKAGAMVVTGLREIVETLRGCTETR